jgi:hypothetical protein
MGTRAARRPAWLLVFLGVAGTIPVLRSLLVPDLNWCYPYLSPDSYDWIANGLRWAGEPVASSWRPPGLPLVIAALWKLGALSLLPLVNFLFLGVATAALYALLREWHEPWLCAVAAWFFFANDYVQDFAKYIMAEIYGTAFLALAAFYFIRARRDPRKYREFGAALALCFLFSYVALPAAVGFGVSLVLSRREHLTVRQLWTGVVVFGVAVIAWVAFRYVQYHGSMGPRHGVEALIRPGLSNVGFYLFAGLALVGLGPLPLYAAGLLEALKPGNPAERDRFFAMLGPLVSVTAFWMFVYDWADKRFLLYVLPFLVSFLAGGLALLLKWARMARPATVACAGYLVCAVLWNQIRYPSYGFFYLALTPQRFVEAARTSTPAYKTELHVAGSRVVRIHETLSAAFTRGLFDPRSTSGDCPISAPEYRCLGELKREADRLLRPGEPIGLFTPRVWPVDYWSATNRLANVLLRPVVLPNLASVTFEGSEVPGTETALARCGPYALVARR